MTRRKRALILFLATITIGGGFRLAGLGTKIYSHDESYTSLRAAGFTGNDVFATLWDGRERTPAEIQRFLRPDAERTIRHTLASLARSEPQHSPLFFVLAHYWIRHVGHTPEPLRALAALLGILSIPAAYWLAKELFGSGYPALLTVLLFAASPYHILFSQDARPYSLLTLAVLLSSGALLRAMRRDTTSTWLQYAATLILGIYSHQLFAFAALAHVLYFTGLKLKSRRSTAVPRLDARQNARFVVAGSMALLAGLPWLLVLIARWETVASKLNWSGVDVTWRRFLATWLTIGSSPFVDFPSGGALYGYVLRAAVVALIVYAALFLVIRAPARCWLLVVLFYLCGAGFLVIPDLLMGGSRSLAGRYYVTVNIATILVVSHYLGAQIERSRGKRRVGWEIVVLLLLLVQLTSDVVSARADTWWNKRLGRINHAFVTEINQNNTLLLVTGQHGNNLGDILLLGFEIDRDVRFMLTFERRPLDWARYQRVYWFPSSALEVQDAVAAGGIRVTEVLRGMLWTVEPAG